MAFNTIKGLTVEIGGDTTKLGKALDDVNKKGRDVSSELSEINKLLKFNPGNTDLLAQKQKVLADAIANSAEKLETLKKAEKQVQEQFKRGEVSEDQVRALQREIIQTESKMKSYQKEAKETAKQTDKFGQAAKAAVSGLASFGATAAKVATTGLAVAATAATAAAGALAKMSTGAAAYADEILTTSTVTGIATDKLQAYTYAAELVDVSVETLTKSQAKNIKSMAAVQNGTKQMVEAYDKLGVAATNADGSLRDGETVYWEVIDALGKMENETERDAIAMQILGKSAQELNPLIEAGSARMAELAQEAQDVGAVMSEDALNAMGAFDDSLQRLQGSAGAAKNALGSVLLPELTTLATEGTALISEFTRTLNESGGGLEGFLIAVEEIGPQIGEKIGELFGGIIEKASELIPSIITIGMSLVTSLVESIVAQAPALVETGIQAMVAILDGLTKAIPRVVQAVVDMIPQLVQALVEGIPQMIDGAVQLLLAILDAIPLIIPPLVEAIPQIVTAVIGGLLDAIPDLIDGAVTFLLAIVDAIPLLIEALIPEIPTIVDTVINGLLACMPALIQGAIQLLFGILEALPQICAALNRETPRIVTTIVTSLVKSIPELVKAGGQLLSGLVKGMMDFDLTKSISKIGNSIVKGFKKIFDIHSPSRVMAQIGGQLSEGLAVGIEDNAKAPVSAVAGLSEDLLNEAGQLNGLAIERNVAHTFAAPAAASVDTGIAGRLDKILAAVERGQILTIDGKTLVGATASMTDSALGQRRALVARGAV